MQKKIAYGNQKFGQQMGYTTPPLTHSYYSASFSTKGATLQRSTVKMRVALGSMP